MEQWQGRPILSVTQLNNQLKGVIEPYFQNVLVKGEISRPVYHSSGHLYFTLKDEGGVINGAMWRRNLSRLPFILKGGEQVVVEGSLSLYPPRGEYKIIATNIHLLNQQGRLQEELERLKWELHRLGYFDPARKKPLPRFPSKIAIVTSRTGAALQDMLRIARQRWRLTRFYIIDSLVQGREAAADLARKIEIADRLGVDLIIVGRGGGSLEDLWAFNERIVADAIFRAKTPIISAVGHEIDYLISDFVADRRAATPSNSIEIALPDQNEVLQYLDQLMDQFGKGIEQVIHLKRREWEREVRLMEAYSPRRMVAERKREREELAQRLKGQLSQLISLRKQEVERLRREFSHTISNFLTSKRREVAQLTSLFEKSSPERRVKEYMAEIWKGGAPTPLSRLKEGDEVELFSPTCRLVAKIVKSCKD